MAYYVGGMGEYYHSMVTRLGYSAEADAIRDAWVAGDRGKAANAISDAMLENVCVLGSKVECRTKLDRFRDAGADVPIVNFPHGSSQEAILQTLEALAPEAAVNNRI